MVLRNIAKVIFFSGLLVFFGCQKSVLESPAVAPSTLRDVPALRLNFRYEADVPAPPEATKNTPAEERNAAVQADFDQNRAQELLDKTIVSPDRNRVLAVYHLPGDVQAEFRLDMYAADGKFLRRVTPDAMAVHFPDTIVWSPDSTTVAFVAMTRAGTPGSAPPNQPDANTAANTQTNSQTNSAANSQTNAQTNSAANADANSAIADSDANANVAPPVATAPTPVAPTGILTFRTEQIYTCGSDGDGIKPVTQNEGLIYFYYVWSPDSSMLASLAATYREWQFLQLQADQKGEQFAPLGRPRLVEKSGRERRLDDALTLVQPVWSPDSAKVAVAFDRQIRIYDAIGNNTTQAAVPLRNQLLLSSQSYDQELQRKEAAGGDANAQTNANAAPNQPTTLPDEASLVSFNPIIDLRWTTEEMLYFQTGYIKQMRNEADSARSYLRWHRLILSPQPVSLGK
jgi:hypothetical protein